MLSRSFFTNFGQGPFPKIAGKTLQADISLPASVILLVLSFGTSYYIKGGRLFQLT